MKMICRSMEQGGVRAGPSCSCVLGFAGASDSLVLLLGLWVLEAWSSANPGPVLGDSVWVSGLQSPAPVSQLPGRQRSSCSQAPSQSLAGAQGWGEVR